MNVTISKLAYTKRKRMSSDYHSLSETEYKLLSRSRYLFCDCQMSFDSQLKIFIIAQTGFIASRLS